MSWRPRGPSSVRAGTCSGRTGRSWQELAFVPVIGKTVDFAALVETQSHQLLGSLHRLSLDQ